MPKDSVDGWACMSAANEQQKLVIIDVTGESAFVLKMAVGAEADCVEQEALGAVWQPVLKSGREWFLAYSVAIHYAAVR